MTTQPITNVSWRPTGDAPQMNNVHCPKCGEECFNTWGLVEHLKTCTGTRRTPDNELVWVVVNGFDLALFPWEDPAVAVAEAEAVLQEKEDRPGLGLDVDVLPWEVETEQEADDADPLGFSAMLDEYRAAHPKAAVKPITGIEAIFGACVEEWNAEREMSTQTVLGHERANELAYRWGGANAANILRAIAGVCYMWCDNCQRETLRNSKDGFRCSCER